MFTCGLTKLKPMAMAKIGAGLLISLSACPGSRSLISIENGQDISEGTILLSSDLPVENLLSYLEINSDS